MKTRLPAVASAPAEIGIFEPQTGPDLAGGGIDGLEAAIEARRVLVATAGKPLPRLHRPALICPVLLFLGEQRIAALIAGQVEQIELGIVGGRLPVLAAVLRRTELAALRHGARAVGSGRVVLHVLA